MSDKETRTILFLCTGNACRSQMAEGFARKALPPGWRALSAGIIAAGLHPLAVVVMQEAGIDIRDQRSKALGEIPVEEVDRVVTLCGDVHDRCPSFPRAVASEHWPIEDPIHTAATMGALPAFRRARDEIQGRVEELVRRLAGEEN